VRCTRRSQRVGEDHATAVNHSTVQIESGEVWVGDVKISTARGNALRGIRSRIVFIAQKHDLVDRLKVYQNVMAGALGRWSSAHALRFLLCPSRASLRKRAKRWNL